jgi:hypothetical protein
VTAGVVATASVFAGSVVAGQLRGGDPSALSADLETGTMQRVADISADGGRPARGVYVQRTSAGLVCLWDAPSGESRMRQGGCNDAADPLAGKPLSASLSYDGGPSLATVRDARLIGLAAAKVAMVEVVFTDGSTRAVRLRDVVLDGRAFKAFGYRMKTSDLRRGVGPAAVVALDADEQEIARQTTGIG